MEKMKMHSMSVIDENVRKIEELFPECVTEIINDKGELEKVVDMDVFKQLFSKVAVEGRKERYQFTWPDKSKAIALVNQEVTSTLRPCREESLNFDTTENLYIEGDNLEVLKLLQETYLGKIKMIYIDPPYNTGNDFVYEDDFSQDVEEYKANSGQYDNQGNRLFANTESNGRFHTDWLNMMYPRLRLAKDLLSDDGVIFISIDDNEACNLKKLCDEVFGETNFICEFFWEKKKKPSFLHRNVGKIFDYIFCYAKNVLETIPFSVEKTTEGKKFPINNSGNGLSVIKFPPHSVSFSMTDQVVRPQDMSEGNIVTNLLAPVIIENGLNSNELILEGEWRYSQAKIDEIIDNGEQITISKIPFRPNHVKQGGEIKKMRNVLSSESYQCETNEDGTAQIVKLLGSNCFSNPKPVGLIELMCKATLYSSTDAIVLDFFSGSATTAHAVMKLNAEDGGHRKFIMVQLPEECDKDSEAYKDGYKNICEIGKERIRRAGKQILDELKENNDGLFSNEISLDVGFRNLKLDSSNMEDIYYTPDDTIQGNLDGLISNIKNDRSSEDLLFQVMLDLGVLLSAKIEEEEIAGKKVFNVDNGYLIVCFDEDVNEDVIIEAAKRKPTYFVMRDSSLSNDSVSVNFDQIFARYSPDTIRKVL